MDVSKRTGCTRNGGEDVKRSGWFDGFDWLSFEQGVMVPPWIPEINDILDISCFSESGVPDEIVIERYDPWPDGDGSWCVGF